MKRLLVYNQKAVTGPQEPGQQSGIQVEHVERISEVLRKLLLSSQHPGAAYDMFLVSAEDITTDLVEFLRYIRKHKPDLPLVIFTSLPENKSLLNQLLKDSGCQVFESVSVQGAFSVDTKTVLNR